MAAPITWPISFWYGLTCSQSSTNPTERRNEAAPTTTQPCLVWGTRTSQVPTTATQIATPPIIAVGFLCQRSIFGLATNPQRRANVRTTGVSARASANDAAGGNKIEALKGIMFRD